MKVLILAAGYGTRLKELGEDTAKGLLPVGSKPILDHIIDRIKDLDVLSEIIVVTNDKFYTDFSEWQKNCSLSVPVSIVNDGTLSPEDRLGSIGDIDFVLKEKMVDEDLLVVGGDNIFDFNLQEYMQFATTQPGSVTIGLYDIGNLMEASKFGIVEVDDKKEIISFEEKPENPKSTLAAMCFYYLPKATLPLVSRYLEEIEKSDTAGDYIRWLHQRGTVYGFSFQGVWYDIGSIESYNEAQEKFKA